MNESRMRPVPAEAVLGAFRLKTPKSAAQGRKPATIPCLRAGLKPVPKARIEFSAARKVMPQEEIEMEVIEKKECNPSHPSRKDKNAARVGHPGGAPSAQVGHPAPRWGTQHPGGAPSLFGPWVGYAGGRLTLFAVSIAFCKRLSGLMNQKFSSFSHRNHKNVYSVIADCREGSHL